MGKHNPDSTNKKPQNIHNGRETARGIVHIFNFLPKWPQSQNTQFKSLDTKWNADNGYTKSET